MSGPFTKLSLGLLCARLSVKGKDGKPRNYLVGTHSVEGHTKLVVFCEM